MGRRPCNQAFHFFIVQLKSKESWLMGCPSCRLQREKNGQRSGNGMNCEIHGMDCSCGRGAEPITHLIFISRQPPTNNKLFFSSSWREREASHQSNQFVRIDWLALLSFLNEKSWLVMSRRLLSRGPTPFQQFLNCFHFGSLGQQLSLKRRKESWLKRLKFIEGLMEGKREKRLTGRETYNHSRRNSKVKLLMEAAVNNQLLSLIPSIKNKRKTFIFNWFHSRACWLNGID